MFCQLRIHKELLWPRPSPILYPPIRQLWFANSRCSSYHWSAVLGDLSNCYFFHEPRPPLSLIINTYLHIPENSHTSVFSSFPALCPPFFQTLLYNFGLCLTSAQAPPFFLFPLSQIFGNVNPFLRINSHLVTCAQYGQLSNFLEAPTLIAFVLIFNY